MRYKELVEAAVAHVDNKLDIAPSDPRYTMYKKSLSGYTGSGSSVINDALHKMYRGQNFKATALLKQEIQMLDDIMLNHPLKSTLTVYHGLKESPFRIWLNYDVPLNKSVIVHLPAFTSTSTDLLRARGFTSPDYALLYAAVGEVGTTRSKLKNQLNKFNILKMKIAAGTPGLSVKEHSNFPDENEILLSRGINLRINPGPVKSGNFLLWDCEVLSVSPVEHFEESKEVNEESEFQFVGTA